MIPASGSAYTYSYAALGEMLLIRALTLAVQTAQTVAAAVIEVDAKDAKSQAFYAKYGFKRLPDDALHMYLPMATARELLAGKT